MSTIATIVTRARTRLEEADARKWSDADQLIPYASEAHQWLARVLNRIPKAKRFRYRETFTWTASSETYAVSGLTKQFDWLVSLAVQVSSLWVPVCQFEDDDENILSNLSLGGGFQVPRVTLQDGTLYREPIFRSDQTFRIRYGYTPAVTSSSATTIETPPEYDLDLVNRLVHFALADAGMKNTAFEEEYAARLGEIEELERSRLGVRSERVVQRARMFGRCR